MPDVATRSSSGTTDSALRVRFWGVRGSVAVPGSATARYGGNTACVEVRCQRHLVILDAGTGIRELGKRLSPPNSASTDRIWLLITHTHWDHIQGFPFFAPVYEARRRIGILSRRASRSGLRRTLAAAVESPFFPVPLREMPGSISFRELRSEKFRLGPFRGQTAPLNHPGGGVAFRLNTKSGSVAYIPDHEIPAPSHPGSGRHTAAAHRRQARMLTLARGVDLLIHDAQYTPAEYAQREGWGHSAVDRVVRFAAEAGAKTLFLFHHDPDRSDAQMDQFLTEARTLARTLSPNLRVEAAQEGMEVTAAHGSLHVRSHS
ncbi:MAG: MBL fold metallo-hydrolase [Verrucomicrobiales bacterium]|nr:MBL fold metallo-hydrolase [Verrucomicrobiales bacterium]